MRKYYLMVFLFVFIQNLYTQNKKNSYPLMLKTFITIGYSYSTPGNLEEYYDIVFDAYTSVGIQIPKQTEFGRTLMLNGGLLFSRLETISIGFSFGYLYSPAYAGYKDLCGTLKVNGFVNSYEIALKIKAQMTKIKNLPVFISVQPGVSYASAGITEELKYFDYPQSNFDRKWSTSVWGPSFQTTVGVPIQLEKYVISFEGGYRYSWNKAKDGSIEPQILKRIGTLDFGQHGLVFLISLERTF